jgi:hypothetical protein
MRQVAPHIVLEFTSIRSIHEASEGELHEEQ